MSVTGMDELRKKLSALPDDVVDRVRRSIKLNATVVKNEIIDSMNLPKSGRLYGSHRASAPGEAPAIDSGNLRNSILAHIDPDGLSATVGVMRDVPYAARLEFGGFDGEGYVAPRPFIRPAWAKMRPRITESVARAVRTALRGTPGG